jgi:hypothetical protein
LTFYLKEPGQTRTLIKRGRLVTLVQHENAL